MKAIKFKGTIIGLRGFLAVQASLYGSMTVEEWVNRVNTTM